MAYKLERVEVWAGPIDDKPGGAAAVLDSLAEAGADLEFVIARRDKKGKGVIFVAPLKGAKLSKVAKDQGLHKAENLQSLRVAGEDRPGLVGELTKALAGAGINLRGISAAAMSGNSVVYLGFDSRDDATAARRVLKKALGA